jgi:NTP pyrophosphatase (non-canonical NTP hydrolase)
MDLTILTERMHEFVHSKGWYKEDSARPQTGRNLAQAMMVECAEVLELYAWDQQPPNSELAPELADVALYLLQSASLAGIDLEQAILQKLEVNSKRSWDGE